MKILLIDNLDSFTYNLHQLIDESGYEPIVCNDELFDHSNDDLSNFVNSFSNIIFSPGPGLPSERKGMQYILENFPHKNILGICLGHQAIAEYFGAKLSNHVLPQHGIKSIITNYQNSNIFKNIPQQFDAGRYHSWYVDETNLPDNLTITCRSNDGVIMGLKHKSLSIEGLQFHPESYLSQFGLNMIQNFMSK